MRMRRKLILLMAALLLIPMGMKGQTYQQGCGKVAEINKRN